MSKTNPSSFSTNVISVNVLPLSLGINPIIAPIFLSTLIVTFYWITLFSTYMLRLNLTYKLVLVTPLQTYSFAAFQRGPLRKNIYFFSAVLFFLFVTAPAVELLLTSVMIFLLLYRLANPPSSFSFTARIIYGVLWNMFFPWPLWHWLCFDFLWLNWFVFSAFWLAFKTLWPLNFKVF